MIGQLSRFVSIGALTTVLHVVVALLAKSGLGLSPLAANLSGFAVAVTLSYIGHGRITFAARLEHGFHAPRFLVVSGLGLVLSTLVTQVVTVSFGAPFYFSMAAVAVIVPALTFLLCKFWVFYSPQPESS